MQSFFAFAAAEPFAAIIIVLITMYALTRPFRYAFSAYNRHLRSKNIVAHGWPTAPIDADGDVVWPTEKTPS